MKLLLILALFASLTLAQDKSKLEPAKPPVLADADKLAIKDLQLTIVAADRDLLQLQISYDQTKTKRDKSVAGLEALIEKLKPKDCPKCSLTEKLTWEAPKDKL